VLEKALQTKSKLGRGFEVRVPFDKVSLNQDIQDFKILYLVFETSPGTVLEDNAT
jgi:hypothetical protein